MWQEQKRDGTRGAGTHTQGCAQTTAPHALMDMCHTLTNIRSQIQAHGQVFEDRPAGRAVDQVQTQQYLLGAISRLRWGWGCGEWRDLRVT